MPVSCNMPRVRMPGQHHGFNSFTLPLMGIYKDQVFAGFNLVMPALEFLILGVNPEQATFPGAKQSRYNDQNNINKERNVWSEWLQVHHEPCADDADNETDVGAYEPVSEEIECFKIITRMKLFSFETSFILTDYMQKPIIDSDIMQIARYPVSLTQGWREII
jgi:hypothetical protein